MRRTSKNELSKINKDIKSYMELLDKNDIKISADYIKTLKDKKVEIEKDLELLDTLGKEQ